MGFPTPHISHVLDRYPSLSQKDHIDFLILYSECHPSYPPQLIDDVVSVLGPENEFVQKSSIRSLVTCVREVSEVGFEMKRVLGAFKKTYQRGKVLSEWKEQAVEWLLTHDE